MTSDEREMKDASAIADDVGDLPVGEETERSEKPVAGDGEGPGSQEAEELKDRYLRLAAEYDNYRKRTERERAETRDRAQAQLIEGLLEPLDDLQRVAQFNAEGTTVEALLEGVQLVEKKLMRALEGLGLEAMDAHGRPFNPDDHEALMTAMTDDPKEDDTVGEVFQTGYRFRGFLIRPARVQVRKHEG